MIQQLSSPQRITKFYKLQGQFVLGKGHTFSNLSEAFKETVTNFKIKYFYVEKFLKFVNKNVDLNKKFGS